MVGTCDFYVEYWSDVECVGIIELFGMAYVERMWRYVEGRLQLTVQLGM